MTVGSSGDPEFDALLRPLAEGSQFTLADVYKAGAMLRRPRQPDGTPLLTDQRIIDLLMAAVQQAKALGYLRLTVYVREHMLL